MEKDESVITNYDIFSDNELDNTIRPETIDDYYMVLQDLEKQL